MGTHRTLTALLVLFACLVIGLAGAWYYFAPPKEPARAFSEVPYSSSEPVAIYHSTAGHTHAYRGEVPVGPGCDVIISGITASGNGVPHLRVAINLVRPPTPCADPSVATTSQEFFVSYGSASSTTVAFDGLTINGIPTAYTLTEE